LNSFENILVKLVCFCFKIQHIINQISYYAKCENTNKSFFLPSTKLTMLRLLNNISLQMINFEQEYLIDQSHPKNNLSLVKSNHHFPSLGNSTICYYYKFLLKIGLYISMEWSMSHYPGIFIKKRRSFFVRTWYMTRSVWYIVYNKRKI
jgi:hypothetical protein